MRLSWCVLGPMVPLLLLVRLCGGCQIHSAPQCFRNSSRETVYRCEWNSTSAQRHVLHFSQSDFIPTEPNWIKINEEELITSSEEEVWVEPEGRPHCASPKTNITLAHTIRFDRPRGLSVQWSQDHLTLNWSAPEDTRAAVEIRHQEPSHQWKTMNLTTNLPTSNKYSLMVQLQESLVEQLQIRHRSTTAKNPLWSHWSHVLTAPPAFSRIRKKRLKETMAAGKVRLQRRLRINWKSVPNAVRYHVKVESLGVKGCTCSTHGTARTNSSLYHVSFGSFSATNVTIRAANAEGESPPVMFHVAPEIPPDLTLCNKTALKKRGCRQWYELWDERAKEQTLISLSSQQKSIEPKLKDYVPYVYYEHQLRASPGVTRRVCLFYQKQGKPVSPPRKLTTSTDHKTLSWDKIPSQDQHGLIIYYSLCVQSGQTGPNCTNISSSERSFHLNNLSPGTKYNVSLSGATVEGEGPQTSAIINTKPERPYNPVLSLGLLICFFLLSTWCTFIFTRIQNKVFGSVPSPVIPDFSGFKADVQEVMEEEVLTVTLLQLRPECSPLEDTEEHCSLSQLHQEDKPSNPEDRDDPSHQEDRDDPSHQEDRDDPSHQEDRDDPSHQEDRDDPSHQENRDDLSHQEDRDDPSHQEDRDDPSHQEPSHVQSLQHDICLLIYRNGLVFDSNSDST